MILYAISDIHSAYTPMKKHWTKWALNLETKIIFW